MLNVIKSMKIWGRKCSTSNSGYIFTNFTNGV